MARVNSLTDLLTLDHAEEATHAWASARPLPGSIEAAAIWLADWIAQHRCGGAPSYYTAWERRAAGGDAHPPVLAECLRAFVASESIGTPEAPAPEQHLQGFVAEHLWAVLITEGTILRDTPVRVDGPDWSVTDSGGDGLAIYRRQPLGLAFSLWESKAHTGAGEIRDTVNGACRQLDGSALRYLARFSKLGQQIPDVELRNFYAKLPELWKLSAHEAGGGICVTANDDPAVVVEHCFGNLGSYWNFSRPEQRRGVLALIADLPAFASRVREHLWKGL